MTDKEFVLSIYPTADIFNHNGKYVCYIFEYPKSGIHTRIILSRIYCRTPEEAWDSAKKQINDEIMQKFTLPFEDNV